MAANGKIGEPVPKGMIGSDAPPAEGMAGAAPENRPEKGFENRFENAGRVEGRVEDLGAIREELSRIRESVAQLTETTAAYARQRVEGAAQTAVSRYPVVSMMAAAFVGYLLAGPYRYRR